jgi:hypothetical protein
MKVSAALKGWAFDTAVRGLKTSAQSLVALLGAGAFNVVNAPWTTDLGIALGAGVLSVLQNIQSLPSPHFTDPAPVLPPAPETLAQPVAKPDTNPVQ